MSINYSELKKKEVVNVTTGKNLGKIIDLVIERDSGKILKIVVPGKKGGFLNCENEELDFSCIVKIGDDAILYKKCNPKKDDCECFEIKPCDVEDE